MMYFIEISSFEARARFMRQAAGFLAVGRWADDEVVETIGMWEGKMNPGFALGPKAYEFASMAGYLDDQDAVLKVVNDPSRSALLLWSLPKSEYEGRRLWAVDGDRTQLGSWRWSQEMPAGPGWTYLPNRGEYLVAEFGEVA